MIEAAQYIPTVAWRTIINDVVMLTAGDQVTPGTYRVTISPIDINEPGAVDAEKDVGYYIKDYVGYIYRITAINVGGDSKRVIVSDDFLTGYGPQTGRTAIVYKSVGMGESPYIAPLEHRKLDQSALDYSRKIELDILYKRLYNEVFENDLGKWLLNTFGNNVEFGQAIGQDNLIEGERSIAIGQGLNSTSLKEILLGAYATIDNSQNPSSWVTTDRLITIGNGQTNSLRSTALEIFKSGFLKLYNAISIGQYQYGAEIPPDGTIQWLVNTLQVYFIDAWYNILTGLPETITGDTTNTATAAGHTHELGEHKHDKLYQPNETNAFVYTDNTGTLHIDGNIVQNGSAYETHAEQVYTKDDTIILRDGAVSGLSTGQYAGFTAKLYDGANDGQLVFDNTGTARVGDVGSLQPIATRVEVPITNYYYAYWESANTRLNFRELAATYVSNTPAGNISSITVQTALNELDSEKEGTITAGTTAQYWRGDKSWQTLNTSVVPELTNLYYTDARARAALSLTTTGNSGASTYNNSTGALNVPNYTLSGLGGQPQLNGTGFVKASGTTISYDNSTYYLASNPNGYITSSALSGYATQSWVSSNFDYYGYWNLSVNSGSTAAIYSNSTVNFIAGSNVSLSRSGNNVTINSTGGDSYSYWLAYVDGGGPITVGSTSYVNFLPGTNMTLVRSGNDIIFNASGGGTYSAGTGLSLSGSTFNHSNSVTPGTASGGSGTLSFGGTFTVPTVTYDAQGHVISKGTTTYTLPTETGGLGDHKVAFHDNTSLYGYLNSAYYDIVGGVITPKRDSTPTSGSALPVTSSGVYTALADKAYKFGNSTTYFFASEYNYGGSSYWNTYGESGSSFKIQYYNGSWSIKSYLDLNRNWYANNFILDSDVNLKKNIKPIDTSKKDFRFVEFQMKATDELRYGVIAQEVEQIAPELVKTNQDGIKSVAYIDLLILKIAELEARIKELEKHG